MQGRHWLTLILCCVTLSASQGGAENRAMSLEQAKQASQQNPQSSEAQNALGEALDEAGRFDAAHDAFQKAIQLKPSYGEAYLNLGLVLLQLNRQDEAAHNLDRAAKLLGNAPEAGYGLYLRAKIYTADGQYNEALRALNRSVMLRPDLAEAWSDLGEIKKIKLDDKGALAAFSKAVQLNPDDAVAQYRLGAEYLRQNSAAPAVAHLQLAYQHSPQDQSVLNALQSALRKQGKIAEANQIRAQLAKVLRDRDRAMQNAVAAVKLNDEGATLQKEGNLQAALEKYREASQLYPDHIGIRVNYAVALLRLGQWTDGLNQLHEALRRDPGNAQIRTALKDALSQAPSALVPTWSREVQ